MPNYDQRLSGINPLAYVGVEAYQPSEFYKDRRAPTVADALNFQLGAWWLNTVNEDLYYLGSFREGGVQGQASWNLIAGGGGSIVTLTGNDAVVVNPLGGNINVVTDNANIIFNGATANTLTMNFALTTNMLLGADGAITSGTNNVGLGTSSLAAISSGSSNTATGVSSLSLATTANSNSAYGAGSLLSNVSSHSNTAYGQSSLTSLTGGSGENVAVGAAALASLLTGTNCIALGFGAGINYSGVESDNISIGATGTLGESGVIRIGTSGDQTTAFMQGIYGVAPVGPPEYVVIDANGQLGTDGSAGSIFLNVTNVNTTPYPVLLTDSLISVDSTAAIITIQLPNAPASGQVFYVKDRLGQAAINNIIVTTVGGVVLIDGAATFTMNTAYESGTFVYNGLTTAYEII